jgi:hypothetical protein
VFALLELHYLLKPMGKKQYYQYEQSPVPQKSGIRRKINGTRVRRKVRRVREGFSSKLKFFLLPCFTIIQ